jgi:hypothetical protein
VEGGGIFAAVLGGKALDYKVGEGEATGGRKQNQNILVWTWRSTSFWAAY